MVSKANSYIIENIKNITQKISLAVAQSSKTQHCKLVAVSKTKPMEDIITAYEGGHRQFGENYIEEFLEKIEKFNSMTAQQVESPEEESKLPMAFYSDIQWHFIGHIQSNKAKKLIDGSKNIRNFLIETIDSEKLANKINKECEKIQRQEPVGVLVQVLTSDEGTKFGVQQDQVHDLVSYIYNSCPYLRFRGLMTMGRLHDIEGFKVLFIFIKIIIANVSSQRIDLEGASNQQ
ncbi:UNKNOWN [Stylonychia lemnae]|uniref:Alanine racemase N-terminal domain-containing protein n=1 Tax=Stylonychia lemnae TaxID=5949 RepID=A0A078AC85_STYLE|nr:UNKNOWN [Stylonychia lemnae]|eukprot:CDW78403.1 UNKNOWN [Stylonychia lemnae]